MLKGIKQTSFRGIYSPQRRVFICFHTSTRNLILSELNCICTTHSIKSVIVVVLLLFFGSTKLIFGSNRKLVNKSKRFNVKSIYILWEAICWFLFSFVLSAHIFIFFCSFYLNCSLILWRSLWTFYATLHFMHGIFRKWRAFKWLFFGAKRKKKFGTNWYNCVHIAMICVDGVHKRKLSELSTNVRRRIYIII